MIISLCDCARADVGNVCKSHMHFCIGSAYELFIYPLAFIDVGGILCIRRDAQREYIYCVCQYYMLGSPSLTYWLRTWCMITRCRPQKDTTFSSPMGSTRAKENRNQCKQFSMHFFFFFFFTFSTIMLNFFLYWNTQRFSSLFLLLLEIEMHFYFLCLLHLCKENNYG